MPKLIPVGLKDHILPFHWDVRLVWGLRAPITILPRADLDYLLDLRLWSAIPRAGLTFDISPKAAIQNPQASPHQYQRVLDADPAFPIDVLHFENRHWILDGVHRLAKLYLLNHGAVSVRIHSHEVIPIIEVSK